MLDFKLPVAFVAWAATTFLAHFSVKQILTALAPAGFEVTSTSVAVNVAPVTFISKTVTVAHTDVEVTSTSETVTVAPTGFNVTFYQ